MDYKSKYLKYKEKYLQLKKLQKVMKGGGPNEDPAKFLKQRTEVPLYYKYSDGSMVQRAKVNLEDVSWDKPNSEVASYRDREKPVPEYTSKTVYDSENDIKAPWADPVDINQKIPATDIKLVDWSVREEIDNCKEWLNACKMVQGNELRMCIRTVNNNCVENGIKLRFSYTGDIKFDDAGYPLNPIGRTGLRGRGTLGNWGPNHAADPVVARPCPDEGDNKNKLQFVLIKRKDNGQWALPGGMVEAGQTIAGTRTREFAEEALASDRKEGETPEQHKERVIDLDNKLKDMFSEPTPDDILYEGVVDDPRNTDQSWMETVAILTVLTGENANLKLEAGDDAGKAKWTNYDSKKELFASHRLFIELAVNKLIERGLVVKETKGEPPNEIITYKFI